VIVPSREFSLAEKEDWISIVRVSAREGDQVEQRHRKIRSREKKVFR